MPSLTLDRALDESFVELRSETRTLLDGMRVVAIPTDLFELLESSLEVGAGGVLHKSATLIVVNENDWLLDPPEIDYPAGFAIEAPPLEGFRLRSFGASGVEVTGPGNQLPDYPGGGDNDGEWDRCPSHACYANPLPPGVVEWKTANPIADGFSVKPENGFIACPVLPKQGVDGVYKRRMPFPTGLTATAYA